ncbi:MAG: hypothetical protein B7O98_08025 [Zestosphaera tikiterensis]|uniref:Uncharacterized protein n=1 Tax=Zestosphaera tikiterensis TaxID=1973259 RepID=A0A2R7Y2Z8_9CREN|nr:MAG: hypothetical protein B7O98_08025 [Zestosphaera tikiterensis]
MVNHQDKNKLLVLIFLEFTLAFFMLDLNFRASSLVDNWPLEGVLIETIIVLMAISIAAWLIFRKVTPSLIFASIITLSLYIAMPVVKYSNGKGIYGIGDPAAHYSFGMWIIEWGHVATNNELYYSSQYGTHPGNGIIPAVVHITAGLDLPLTTSMYLMMTAGYILYLIFLLCLVKRLSSAHINSYSKYLLLLSIMFFNTYFPPYYGGVELSYGFVGLLLYTVVLSLLKTKDYFPSKTLTIFLLGYIGLLLTHYSTTVIITFYLVLTFLTSIILDIFLHMRSKMSVSIALLPAVVFLCYELIVDILLISSTLHFGLQRLVSLYISELEMAEKAMEKYPALTFLDLVKYLLSKNVKPLVILSSISMYMVLLPMFTRLRLRRNNHFKFLALLFLSSLPTWILGWAGTGEFMSGARAIMLIQFVYVLNILSITYDILESKRYGKVGSSLMSVIAFTLIISGFIFNYGLPLGPLLQSKEGDLFMYPVSSQGAVTPWVLHSIEYTNKFLKYEDPDFLCLVPYIGYGLCDLLWESPKIPKHGFISPPSIASEDVIKLIDGYTNVVVPIPSSDKVLPGPIGYKSYYLIPYNYCLNRCKGKIYTNGLYNLFTR